MKTQLYTMALFIFATKFAWAQNPNLNYNYAVKLSNLTSVEEQSKSRKISNSSSYSNRSASKTIRILQPTIAFQWKTLKNNLHEIELTRFMVGKNEEIQEMINDSINFEQLIGGSDQTTTDISVRYEYIVNFNKSKTGKIVPSVGFGMNPYFKQVSYVPMISSSFPTNELSVGMRTFLTPRLTYFLSQKVFLDVNIPICLFDTYYFNDRIDNPTYSAQERTIATFNFNQFPRIFSGRIGVGIKL